MQICDIFVESNDFYRFDEVIQNLEKYSELTDNILKEIYNSDNPSLNTAIFLVKKLFNEDFYTPI